jgi:iron complex transport system substrate-binding protein
MAALAGVPRVEGAESVLEVRPSLVLGTDVVTERSPELVSFLGKRGVEVWLMSPVRLDDVFTAVADVASRLGLPEQGRDLLSRLRARAGALPAAAVPGTSASTSAMASRPGLPVFVYDCCDPAFTAAGKTVLTDLIARAGGRNIFADLDADWTKVSWEEVIARRPGLILIHDYAYAGQGDVESKRQQLRSIPSLAGLPTAVFPLGLSLGGIRSVDALERLQRILATARGPG